MRYVRLYGDEQGESHFEEVAISLETVAYAPPAPPLDLSAYQPATNFFFMHLPSGWEGDWHPSPQRQMVIVVSGIFEVEAGDGEVRRFYPGDVKLGDDTQGRGHRSRSVGDTPCLLAIVHLA